MWLQTPNDIELSPISDPLRWHDSVSYGPTGLQQQMNDNQQLKQNMKQLFYFELSHDSTHRFDWQGHYSESQQYNLDFDK